MIGGSSDHDNGQDGFDRGIFNRFSFSYANTLESGLEVKGKISHMYLRDDVQQDSPDEVWLSVGGGFGTVTMGHHAMAACATMPRPIAFVPGGVNATWHSLFAGTPVLATNVTFSEMFYCQTPSAISYSTPKMGGLKATVTYAPNTEATQLRGVGAAIQQPNNAQDYLDVAASFSSDMGGMSVDVGASYQTASDNAVDSVSVAGTVSMGGATVGASWFDNGDTSSVYRSGSTGWNIGAKYALGALTPAVTFSSQKQEMTGVEETALVAGVNYELGGGFSVFAEYLGLETETPTDDGGMSSDDETLLMSGVIVSF